MSTELTYQRVAAGTWVDLLRSRAELSPKQDVFHFLGYEEEADASITYGELDRRARAIAAQLQSMGAVGERAMIMYPPGIDYIIAFFGCLYAGVTAVPTYPPRQKRNLSLQRVQKIVINSQASVGLTTPELLTVLKGRASEAPVVARLPWLTPHAETRGVESIWREPDNDSSTLAFLQYTSGSTGSPKGVMVSHGNLLHNAELSREHFEYHAGTHLVYWVPFYHDLGLILGILQPIYTGFQATFMSPFAFVQHPLRWLRVISEVRGTATSAPNFAYELCVRKVTDEDLATLDLSSLEWAANIAEPVRPSTLEHFCTTFGPCGFRPEAFYPAWGLAEATLFTTGGRKALKPIYTTIQKAALERGQVVSASADDEDAYTLVSCGQPLGGQRVVVVDPEKRVELGPEQIGEIWVSGPSMTGGYWHAPHLSQETYGACLTDSQDGPFLRTGDLGFFKDGELYIAGRRKDVIIIDGRNHYPQDIELTAGTSHPAIRPGLCVAFSVDVEDEERLVVVVEIDQRYRPAHKSDEPGEALDAEAVVKAIRRSVAEEHDLQVYHVLLLKSEGIQKTSSGKVKRRSCRADYLAGEMQPWEWEM
ncbi:MAG TPA: fatty acyl-AMP ligase [Ktedonobacteraceae bacterium]